MGEKVFLIQMYGPKQLQITWKLGWHDVKVKVGEELLGLIEKKRELIKGKTFTLVDGSQLKVQLDQTLSSAGLAVFHNGKPLHGSAADPVTRYQAAYGSLYVIGFVNAVAGAVAYFFNIDLLQRFGFSLLSVISGSILFTLGFLVKKGSRPALLAGIVLYFLDGVGSSIISYLQFRNIGILNIATHLLFLVLLFQGISAIREITGTNPKNIDA